MDPGSCWLGSQVRKPTICTYVCMGVARPPFTQEGSV